MEQIRQYLLTIIAAAIFCAIVNSLFGKKGTVAATIKMLSGLFLAVTLLAPLTRIQISNLTDFFEDLDASASGVVAEGEQMAAASMAAIIKQRTEAYILDKALSLELDLEVEVTLSGANPPIPESVLLIGNASPYARGVLQRYMKEELGIPEEKQTWR